MGRGTVLHSHFDRERSNEIKSFIHFCPDLLFFDASGAILSFETAHATHIDLSLLPEAAVSPTRQSEFSRNTYGLMGLPVDAVSIADTLKRIEAAVEQKKPTLISTPQGSTDQSCLPSSATGSV